MQTAPSPTTRSLPSTRAALTERGHPATQVSHPQMPIGKGQLSGLPHRLRLPRRVVPGEQRISAVCDLLFRKIQTHLHHIPAADIQCGTVTAQTLPGLYCNTGSPIKSQGDYPIPYAHRRTQYADRCAAIKVTQGNANHRSTDWASNTGVRCSVSHSRLDGAYTTRL